MSKVEKISPNPRLTQAEKMDDRPLAVRRKRRLTSSLVSGDDAPSPQKQGASASAASNSTKTPTKAKKKVRFSDPGPETTTASSSTGLTPAMKRTAVAQDTTMLPPMTPGPLGQKLRHRRSLPLDLSRTLPSPSPTPPVTPQSGEVQFTPFRRILDERLKRRIKRNHMSEEQNEFERDNVKSKAAWKQEMQDLKNELAAARQLQQETNDAVKGEDGSHEKIQQLEHEIEELKREMRERSMTVELAGAGDGALENSIPAIYNDNTNDDFVMPDADESNHTALTTVAPSETEVLRDTTHLHVIAPGTDAASQTSSVSSNAENEAFRNARLSLERLFPGEIPLGLRTNDPGPLLNTMIERLQMLKTQILILDDSLATTKTQESNLRNQFNGVLAQLNRARDYADKAANQREIEQDQLKSTQDAERSARRNLEKATGHIKALETDIDEKQRSINKLQNALEGYRKEIAGLEVLITKMESDHTAALSKLQTDMNEAIADRECQVAAETVGRRAAEGESVERGERIKQLRSRDKELRATINEKQGIIRNLEKEQARAMEMKEMGVGGLNAEIARLASDLAEAKSEVNKLKADNKTLLFRVEEEKEAGLKAVDDIQAEMARCVEKSEDVKTYHLKDMQSRGTEVNEHKGLLTPVTGGRFKDVEVEGYVEIQRGKAQRRILNKGVDVVVEEVEEEADNDEPMLGSDV